MGSIKPIRVVYNKKFLVKNKEIKRPSHRDKKCRLVDLKSKLGGPDEIHLKIYMKLEWLLG